MCGRRLKKLSFIFVLLLSVSFLPCFSEVVLTYEEAQELLTEIQKSKEEMKNAGTSSSKLQTELNQYIQMQNELSNMQKEQNQFYKEQYLEARKDRNGAIAISALIVILLLILLV